jgi:hypothetical protein
MTAESQAHHQTQSLKHMQISPSQASDDSLAMYKAEGTAKNLSDEEILLLLRQKHIPTHQLEESCEDYERGVGLRSDSDLF